MLRVLVLDSTEDSEYVQLFRSFLPESQVQGVPSLDIAIAHINKSNFDLVFVTKVPGKRTVVDFCSVLKNSNRNRKTAACLVIENPTVAKRCLSALRGRQTISFKPHEKSKLKEFARTVVEKAMSGGVNDNTH